MKEKIGIIGAGHIGATVARLFIKAGHEVALSNSRGPDTLARLTKELGPKAHAMTVSQAAQWGDIVFLAVPWIRPEALPRSDLVAGKIVIDAMNPYGENEEVLDLESQTSSELTRKRLPNARIVKAFNTKWYKHLAEKGNPDLPLDRRDVIFYATDDVAAGENVARLIEEIGFAPVSTGMLAEGGRMQQPNSPIYNRPMNVEEAKVLLAQEFIKVA